MSAKIAMLIFKRSRMRTSNGSQWLAAWQSLRPSKIVLKRKTMLQCSCNAKTKIGTICYLALTSHKIQGIKHKLFVVCHDFEFLGVYSADDYEELDDINIELNSANPEESHIRYEDIVACEETGFEVCAILI